MGAGEDRTDSTALTLPKRAEEVARLRSTTVDALTPWMRKLEEAHVG